MNVAIKQNLYNPLDTIENIFIRENINFDRRKDNELVAEDTTWTLHGSELRTDWLYYSF